MRQTVVHETDQNSMLKYYVYELRDPTDGDRVFYIGKGQDLRIDAHDGNEKNKKGEVIKRVQSQGKVVDRVVIGRYETEAEAFAVEATLIKWVYGFDALTNQVQGHRHHSIRSRSQATVEIEGIDVPRNLGNGAFTEGQRSKIQANGVVEKLLSLCDALRQKFPGLNISAPDVSRPQDPCIHIDDFLDPRSSIQMRMNVKLGLAGKNISCFYQPKTARDLDGFIAMDSTNFVVRKKETRTPYIRMKNEHTDDNGYISHEDHESIARAIQSSFNDLVRLRGNQLRLLDAIQQNS